MISILHRALDTMRDRLRSALRRWNEWHGKAKAKASMPPPDLPMDEPAPTIHPHTNAPLATRDMDVYGNPF
jgi:hypothetical protein